MLEGTLVRAIEAAMRTTDKACAELTIVDPMSSNQAQGWLGEDREGR